MAVTLNPVGTLGAKIWQDDRYPWKVYGGIGEGIRSFALMAAPPADDTTNSPSSLIATQTGTSPTTVGVAAGYPLLVTTGGTDYNGTNLQGRGATGKTVSGKQFFARCKLKLNQANTSDLLFGVCELKTDLMKTSVSHGVNTSVEGVFFAKISGATTLYAKVHVAGTENASINLGAIGTTDMDLAIWWDGAKVHFYKDDVEVATFSGSLPTVVMTPSINVRTGSAAAVTASIAELSYVEVE